MKVVICICLKGSGDIDLTWEIKSLLERECTSENKNKMNHYFVKMVCNINKYLIILSKNFNKSIKKQD